MKSFIVFFLFIFFYSSVKATLFVPIPLEQQLKESSSVIWGTYLNESYKKLPTGEVTTIGSFQIIKQSGLGYGDFLNRNKIDVLYPGGKWQGIRYTVNGTPKFKVGEEVLLFLKKTPYGLAINNLSLGKYNVSKERNKIFFHSSVFKDHKILGKIKLKDLNELLLKKFDDGLTSIINSQQALNKPNKKSKNRKIASVEEENELDIHHGLSFIWLFFILLGLAFIKNVLMAKWKD